MFIFEKVRESAAVIERGNTILLVREPNSEKWSLPGGTAKPEEGARETLIRGLAEEFLGLRICGSPELFRHFSPSIINPREVTIFLLGIAGEAVPNPQKLEEARWVDSSLIEENYSVPEEVTLSLTSLRKMRDRSPPKIIA